MHSAEQKRGQRRDSYMKKVKEQRDEGRWDARGDQVYFIAETKRFRNYVKLTF